MGARNLGLGPAIFYRTRRALVHVLNQQTPYRLYSDRVLFPLFCRPNTSDVHVFSQVFAARAYRCLDTVGSADFIVDCGANVGYSSAYFLSAYPRATVVAVEPDPANFQMLQRNLAPFGSRAETILSAVWSSSVGLKLDTLGAGLEWARSVRPVRDGESPSVTAVDIGTLWRNSGFKRISILKMDIEGAEREVFSNNYQSWLGQVDNIVIELHGPECVAKFHTAIASQGFEVSGCDELTVCKRPGR
jgi:FkbM family methyltransferase